MLAELHIRGLALLDDVSLVFGPGLTVLTGETGAGKSILVDALVLLRGGRGQPQLVRAGEDRLVVEAVFEVPDEAPDIVEAALERRGLDPLGDEGLIVRREVARKGRSRCFVQGGLADRKTLAEIVGPLLDVCSQHEHHVLARADGQRDVLDRFGELGALRVEVARAHAAWREAADRLAELEAMEADGPDRLEFVRHQIERIERVDPQPGEEERLRERLGLLEHGHRIAAAAHEVREALYEGDGAVVERVGALLRVLSALPRAARLERLEEVLAGIEAACEEAADVARRVVDEVEVDPDEMERLQARLFELESLRRSFATGFEGLSERLEALRTEAARLEGLDEARTELRGQVAAAREALVAAARRLSTARRRAGARLARGVERELADLHMAGARLSVDVAFRADETPGPYGGDAVTFRFSANPGEPPAPLTKVASGGELSRLLLAVKGVERRGARVATYVFDEVDAGVGGAVAEAIGRKLQRAAEGHQVLCITHLPQIAALADRHYRVAKVRKGKRTVTRVEALDDAARVEEIARMLAGARITETARRHAKALIAAR
ncbi:MAG: DNA repair protein RecN [Deltaproteobacteria bacterium]|nr:MAG: DNA repair protein RecN [Deltaproteobacteria bacterium]